MEPLRLLVFARWGSGKTRLASTAAAVPALCPVALWSFDKTTASIDRKRYSVDVFEINTPKELTDAIATLTTGKYRTVILDTLTELHSMMLGEAMKFNMARTKHDRSEYIPEMADYSGAQNGTLQLIRKLRDRQLNIIATAQDGQITEGTPPNEKLLYSHAPLTAKTLSLRLSEFFQLVAYGSYAGNKLVLNFNSNSALVMCKDTRAVIPQPMSDPSIEKIYKLYTTGLNGNGRA